MSKRRLQTASRYYDACVEFYKTNGNWNEIRRKYGLRNVYPAMRVEDYESKQLALSAAADLIGATNRLCDNDPVFTQALKDYLRTDKNAADIKTLQNWELVQELNKRGIKCDANGKFYRDVRVERVERIYLS